MTARRKKDANHSADPARARRRVLFVDDEPNIRLTLPRILEAHGFEVVAVACVPDALEEIGKREFEILLADLNIGQPGDGFTVVSAMRRTQPNAATIIITGYPAFETALQAIRNQVDDYIVKPADVQNLMQVIERCLNHSPREHQPPLKRVATLLRENLADLVAAWLTEVNADAELSAIALTDNARADHVPTVLQEMITMLEQHPGEVSDQAVEAAARHGRQRRQQDYTVPLLVREARLLRRVIYYTVQQHLLFVDISHLLSDLIQINDSLDVQLRRSVEAFLETEKEPRAA